MKHPRLDKFYEEEVQPMLLTKTPELDKMSAVRPKSQAIGEFIEWLHAQGIHLAAYHEHDDSCYTERQSRLGPRRDLTCGSHTETLYTHREPVESLLARFFEIDLKKAEEEKRAVLEELRSGS